MPKDSLTPTKPTPPPGYSVVNLPDFLKPANAKTKTVSAPPLEEGSGRVIADVDPAQPTTIQVRDPNLFTQPVQTHESTHVFQLSRNPAFTSAIQGQQQATSSKDFDYGGVEGLMAAQRTHKTIANFSAEQQARMVEDYQKATQDAIRRGDPAALARATAAYHPFVGQLAKIPPKGANMTQMTRQDLTPAAPPVPPATVAGMPMLPDKLIGGATAPPMAAPLHSQVSHNFVTQSFQGKPIPGIVRSGNIDITNRPNIDNGDGTHSSTFSMGFGVDGGVVSVPGVGDGKTYPLRQLRVLYTLPNGSQQWAVPGKQPKDWKAPDHPTPQNNEALDQYRKTGKNFGTFKDEASANSYGQKLHEDQAKYGNRPQGGLKTVQDLKSQALRLNPVEGGHKIGEVKKFVNGKTGVWDGHGWVAKQQ